MCGRYVSARTSVELAEQYAAGDAAATSGGEFNVAPTMTVPVVVPADGEPEVRALRWGLVPSWAGDLRVGARMINARAETAADKPAFRQALARRRCLVPADAYYEWLRLPAGRRPFAIEQADGSPLTFAGLYEQWADQSTGELHVTFAILTREAGPDTRAIHHRAPVLVGESAWASWLDPQSAAPGRLLARLVSVPSTLAARPIVSLVNSVRNNGPHLLAAAG